MGSLIKYPGGNKIFFFPWAASQALLKTFCTTEAPQNKRKLVQHRGWAVLLCRGRDDLKSWL